MPWNEPGKDKDPWGQKNNDAPPDLDEVLNNFKKKIDALFGGGGKSGSSNGGSGMSEPSGAFTGLIAGAAIVVWLLSGIYIVDEGWRGVVTQFGAKSDVTMPGPHWHIPWPIEAVERINVEAIRTTNHNAQMLTKDENIISLSLSVQYNVNDAQLYAYEVREPDITLKQAAETAIREIVGGNDMDYILTQGRAQISSGTKAIMQEILNSYATGLNVISVNLNEAQPPEQVQEAFADAIKAREDEQRIINEAEAYRNDVVPKARGDA
ncbi:MAG: FtsH protease activity modulator HflK, partial [Gammaproteobacteria bacterium]|nr:FtsH protease activity modulator HflK [Gammaproteobacteria bacterium]